MNIKQITGAISLCALYSAGASVPNGHGICTNDTNKIEETRTVTDDTLKTKGDQDKSYTKAAIAIDSTKNLASHKVSKFNNKQKDAGDEIFDDDDLFMYRYTYK